MPVTPTYPGVYVEEIPSGVHTITGVATSIAAFVGRAQRGPTNDPIMIHSFADFDRIFGGLWVTSSMGFAVRDFFANGGSDAIVVRLFKPDGGANPKSIAQITYSGLTLKAASEGTWGNGLRIRVDQEGSAAMATQWGLTAADLFTLTIYDGGTKKIEVLRNVTVKESPRRIDRVLLAESK